MNDLLKQLSDDLGLLRESAADGVVTVQNGNGRRGSGSGTVWHPDGLVITNAHVVREHSPEIIFRDGSRMPSRIIAYDEELDLAAVSVEASGLASIRVGESKKLRAGEVVLSVGHPWGVLGAATAGVVIGLETSQSNGRELISVDLHLRPGYSGGPLLNVDGELVGVNTMMNGPDVGMAIPVHVVKRFLSDNLTA